MLAFLNRFFAPPVSGSVPALYGAVMAAARAPEHFTQRGLPDTFETRFELLVLHMFLLIGRLQQEADAGERRAGEDLARQLVEYMVSDLDRTCREMGVGDVGVAKRMKGFMSGFYGRLKAYREALDSPDEKEILRALDRNLYAETATDLEKLEAMRHYLRAAAAHLAGLATKDLQNGRVSFSNQKSTG